MHFGCVDLPNELVESRKAGNLVVFAGAGVSIPSPSNLPDFRELAIELAQGTTTLEKDEPLDRFLGRLEPGLRIHEHTRDRLSRPESKPNPLHFNLLKLFGRGSAVRLVTTNFDNHFSTAADEIWKSERPEFFAAPALPLGGDFLGLVHLHGSVIRDPARMVLRDADFGRAYLTEGWARRFLQEMFLKYTVLFVGYSHNDPVMHYLARGLPSSTEGRRFALTPDGDDKFWKYLGIVALAYPIRSSGSPHREQELALVEWVRFTAERPLDRRERIRHLVSNLPPGAGEDHDYLVDALNDEYTARFFAEFARAPEWFEWAQRRDTFLRLFRKVGDVKPTDEPLAAWFAEGFAIGQAGRALAWIAQNRLTLGRVCWLAVAQAIFRRLNPGEGCPGLDKWVLLLIRTWPGDTDLLELILSRCNCPEDATAALLLFRHLLGPAPELKSNRRMRTMDPTIAPDMDLHDFGTTGDKHWTGEAWQRYFRPNLQQFAGSLASIAAAHLEEIALMSKAYCQPCDPVSIRLPDLGAASLYGERSGLGVMVEVAREALFWLIERAHNRADGLVECWWNAESIVLQRLAVLGVAKSAGWPADDKLAWLLERGLLYRAGFRQEVSAVLTAAFRDASPEMKDRLISTALTGPTNAGDYREDRIRTVLRALNTADPACARVTEELLKVPQPPEYVQEAESAPPSMGDLLARPPADQVKELLALGSKDTLRRDRGELASVQRAVAEKPEWGLELAVALRERRSSETVLWRCIVAGWNQDGLTSGQWASALNLLVDFPEVTSIALDEITNLLERRTFGDSNPFKGPLFGLAVKAGLQVWKVMESRDVIRTAEEKDWLLVAINDAAGSLAQFFLRMLWQARKDAGDDWHGLTDDFRSYLEGVIRGCSWAAEMARVVVAASLQTLLALDATWTRHNVFELFAWSTDTRRAQQAWHGYLTWGKWNNDLLVQMLPRCKETFARIDGDLGDLADHFCELMSGIALYGAVDPMERLWLPDFSLTAGLKARYKWTSAVGMFLKSLPKGSRPEVWTRWMKSYWEFRLGTVPALDSGEVVRMAEWSTELEDAFPEAVDLILKSPSAESGDMTRLYLGLQKSGLSRTYPRESARLLRFLVQSQKRLPFGDYTADLVEGACAPRGRDCRAC